MYYRQQRTVRSFTKQDLKEVSEGAVRRSGSREFHNEMAAVEHRSLYVSSPTPLALFQAVIAAAAAASPVKLCDVLLM